jgi:uncharacterized protein (TIGR02246 family)
MDPDEQAIRQLVDKWMIASKAGDLDTVLGMMDDDVLFMVAGREPFGKAMFAAGAQAMKDLRIEGTSEIQEIKVIGEWAWMRNRLKMIVSPLAGPSTRRSGFTLTVLRKNPDGAWVIYRDANLLS